MSIFRRSSGSKISDKIKADYELYNTYIRHIESTALGDAARDALRLPWNKTDLLRSMRVISSLFERGEGRDRVCSIALTLAQFQLGIGVADLQPGSWSEALRATIESDRAVLREMFGLLDSKHHRIET